MPSAALAALLIALGEVEHLAIPSISAMQSVQAPRTRATGRAQAVLLSAHFERYFYAVNEEAVSFLNEKHVSSDRLPLEFRLLHSKSAIDITALTGWERRNTHLEAFMESDGWLWKNTLTGQLNHATLLAWMSAPKPKNLQRYYKYWGIQDIFSSITRTPQTRQLMILAIQEMVDKRNSIAHGDFSAQATLADIRRLTAKVKDFCTRADKCLCRVISKNMSAGVLPWA